MSIFGTCVNKFKTLCDFLLGCTGLLGVKGSAEGENALSGANYGTLQKQEVVSNDTIVRETSHWSDSLFGEVGFRGGVLDVGGFADTVDFLVDFGTVEVAVLTCTSDGVGDTGRMPSSNTGNFAQTLVGFAWQTTCSPTSGNSCKSVTLGDSDHIDHVVLVENRVDVYILFE